MDNDQVKGKDLKEGLEVQPPIEGLVGGIYFASERKRSRRQKEEKGNRMKEGGANNVKVEVKSSPVSEAEGEEKTKVQNVTLKDGWGSSAGNAGLGRSEIPASENNTRDAGRAPPPLEDPSLIGQNSPSRPAASGGSNKDAKGIVSDSTEARRCFCHFGVTGPSPECCGIFPFKDLVI